MTAAQMAFAETIAREEDLVIPDETSASMAAISEWINANQRAKPGKLSYKASDKPPKSWASVFTEPKKRRYKHKINDAKANGTSTIPYCTIPPGRV